MAAARPPDLTSGSDLGLLALVLLVLIFSCPPPTSHRTSQEPFHQTQTRTVGRGLDLHCARICRYRMSIPVERALAPPLVKKNTAIVRPVLTSRPRMRPRPSIKHILLYDSATGANCSLRTSQAITSTPSPSRLVSLDRLFVLGLGLPVTLKLVVLARFLLIDCPDPKRKP
ncbi:hypothetical protein PCASD_16550 [Puccinia coronata f. sp. avenae]|uniref:Uncharacterized protein n=1 Tax=Puccinia coronata f. sp. avenae TaxID=200324 RepID=A0A2N5U2L0_9BASI|nr:hypothetical protein PCASD_16550 [Puccinia coronata f. sp. avenae]